MAVYAGSFLAVLVNAYVCGVIISCNGCQALNNYRLLQDKFFLESS